MAYEWHRPIESRWISFSAATLLAVLIGGIVLLIPPFYMQGTIEPIDGIHPWTGLEQHGRDLYIREGCNNCHSQQVRPLKSETDRYGAFSMAGEDVYSRPFLWGSRRTGPDLARVGGKYPDSWHWIHFRDPREIEARSNMPDFGFMQETQMDLSLLPAKLRGLRMLGSPYTDEQIASAVQDAQAEAAGIAERLRGDGIELSEVQASSEAIALIAYLQSLGVVVKQHAAELAGGG
jgi:cytochrome c oxidase cbb3-type subunit I/II